MKSSFADFHFMSSENVTVSSELSLPLLDYYFPKSSSGSLIYFDQALRLRFCSFFVKLIFAPLDHGWHIASY